MDGGVRIYAGVLLAHSPDADKEAMLAFARRLTDDVGGALRHATGADWIFHHEEDPARLGSDDPRRASDFLDDATLRMAEGPYDLVLVITDVALVSRRERLVAGLASPLARVAVLSTRRLTTGPPRGQPMRPLDSDAVRWNGAALLLHLLGHLLGLGHDESARGSPAMAPFRFDETRRDLPPLGDPSSRLRRLTARLPQREHAGGGWLRHLAVHLRVALRHPGAVLAPLGRNKAPLLPLAMPGLATAAVAPTLLLVFTAEIWDAGLSMAPGVLWAYALGSIVAATLYLLLVQHLFFPAQEKRVITEHLAIVNVAIFLTVLLAMLGLFLMVTALMLILIVCVFPPGLIATWPTLEHAGEVTLADKLRLAAFISTLGVTTGALAGGLESRTVVRNMAFFLEEP